MSEQHVNLQETEKKGPSVVHFMFHPSTGMLNQLNMLLVERLIQYPYMIICSIVCDGYDCRERTGRNFRFVI